MLSAAERPLEGVETTGSAGVLQPDRVAAQTNTAPKTASFGRISRFDSSRTLILSSSGIQLPLRFPIPTISCILAALKQPEPNGKPVKAAAFYDLEGTLVSTNL